MIDLTKYRAGDRIPCGPGYSSILPGMDFETYSEAGFIRVVETVTRTKKGVPYQVEEIRWQSVAGKGKKGGISAVGAPRYAEDPTTEVLSLSYDLKNGTGPQLWFPGMPLPQDLFDYIARPDALVSAWNSAFEFYIWHFVCAGRMGWPALPYWKLRDTMAKARAFSYPGKLFEAGKASRCGIIKDEDGDRLLKKFSVPRKPTNKDPRERIKPGDDPADFGRLCAYNLDDVSAEQQVAAVCPDLSPDEEKIWLIDQEINFRGVQIDMPGVAALVEVVESATGLYNEELHRISGIESATKASAIKKYLENTGLSVPDMQAETVDAVRDRFDDAERMLSSNEPIPPNLRDYAWALNNTAAKRVVEIRSLLGSSSVKKLYAIQRQVSSDGRLRDLFAYHAAHTGRWAGQGAQPQNMPSQGPDVRHCVSCGAYVRRDADHCPDCGVVFPPSPPGVNSPGHEWDHQSATYALETIIRWHAQGVRGRDLVRRVEAWFGDALKTVSGCLRALFIAAPGHSLVCSDFSSVEAVVLAALSECQWRLDAFRDRKCIYTLSAAAIWNMDAEELFAHKRNTGSHHPIRKKGKVAELASGFQGSVGAWLKFGADKYMNENEILDAVKRWRAASPEIPRFWYAVEDAAIKALKYPRQEFHTHRVSFFMVGPNLHCRLPSGRLLTYHDAAIETVEKWGKRKEQVTYWGWTQDQGARKWSKIYTYGGKLVENIVQAVARDILCHALPAIQWGLQWPLVLLVHDEAVSEVADDRLPPDAVDRYEAALGDLPAWCADWPVRASGGWTGRRYRKD